MVVNIENSHRSHVFTALSESKLNHSTFDVYLLSHFNSVSNILLAIFS